MNRFKMVSKEEDAIKFLKAIKSTVLNFDNKCDIYIAMGNITNRLCHFYQVRDMSSFMYYEKYKDLVKVAEEHSTNLGLHPQLL
eukprot:15360066-Ditylum_brightwellii.AAC.1